MYRVTMSSDVHFTVLGIHNIFTVFYKHSYFEQFSFSLKFSLKTTQTGISKAAGENMKSNMDKFSYK